MGSVIMIHTGKNLFDFFCLTLRIETLCFNFFVQIILKVNFGNYEIRCNGQTDELTNRTESIGLLQPPTSR
jgi:hypothetical protein